MRRLIAFTLFVCALSSTSYAQDVVEKSETTYYVETSGGKPTVCGIEYVLAYRDQTYLAGGPAAVKGQLGWIAVKEQIGLIFKLNGIDFPGLSRLDMTPRKFHIQQAFLETGGKPHFVRQTYQCENPANLWQVLVARVCDALPGCR
jgi:hypothetical protein